MDEKSHHFIIEIFGKTIPNSNITQNLFSEKNGIQATLIEREAKSVASLLSTLPSNSKAHETIKTKFENIYDSIIEHSKNHPSSAQVIKALHNLSTIKIPGSSLYIDL